MTKAILHWVSLKYYFIMQSKTSYMASKGSKGEATTKEKSGEFKQHLDGSYKTCLLTRVLVKRALTVHSTRRLSCPVDICCSYK